jgi:hypothetical protein
MELVYLVDVFNKKVFNNKIMNISEFFYSQNKGINYNKYEYINEFIDICKNDFKVLDLLVCSELHGLRTVDHLEEEIYKELDKIRNKLVEK